MRWRVIWRVLFLYFLMVAPCGGEEDARQGGYSALWGPQEVPAAQEDIVRKLLEGVKRKFRSIKDLSADFLQETTIKMVERVRRAEGRIYLKMPGRIRWEYTGQQKGLMVINRDTMWYYDPDENQVTITDLTKVPDARLFLDLLTGGGELNEEFIISPDREPSLTKEGYYLIHLTCREEGSRWKHLSLMIDPMAHLITGISFEGPQGDRTLIQYSNFRLNQGLSDDLFTFQIPEGADVIHYPMEEEKGE